MKTYEVITARRAAIRGLSPSRTFGYYIQITPPIEGLLEGEDVEGVGWYPYNPPRKTTQHFHGWYKHKAMAEKRRAELAKS